MSIAVLTQVYDEMRRLAIAGSNLAAGDFRLTKLVAPLEASAAKAPVFGKVAEAIKKLTASSTADSAQALLELSTLVSAILYTQGETGTEGKLEPIDTVEFGVPPSRTSARILKPLIEALTTTGSGREELIKDAFERGAFQDIRLVRVAVEALDDPYAPIAEYVSEHVLPMYGKAIYADLRAAYAPKGKGGHVRRLRLMHRLDPKETHELVEQALETGSPDIKIAAIQCLEGSPEFLSYLLEQSRSKSSDVRRVALRAMAGLDEGEVVDALIKALSGGDLEIAVESARINRSPKLLKFLLDAGSEQLAALLTIDDVAEAAKAIPRFYHLCGCFASRDDKQTIAFLTTCFDRRDAIAALKGADGRHINRRVAAMMVRSGSKPAVKMLIDAHATLLPELLDWAMLAALRTRKSKEIYDLFSPYYLAKVPPKKKASDPASQKRESVRELLAALSGSQGYGRYFHMVRDYASHTDLIQHDEFSGNAELDPRWLDAAIASEDLEMVQVLVRPKHKGSLEYLSQTMEAMLETAGDLDTKASGVLESMLRIGHPRAVELYLGALRKVVTGKGQYLYWLVQLIPSLPKAAAGDLEAMLAGLPEKVVDQIAPLLAELKAKG